MYGYLLKITGPRWAGWLCALWYAALIIAIVMCSVEPPAEFEYGNY